MSKNCDPASSVTKSLLAWGVLAGPFYVTVSLAQALTRDGFDVSKHAWSLLSNGDLGWIQITNFVLTGLMVLAGAVGLHRALAARSSAPWLVGVYGVSMIAAGVFRPDPAQGFPVGTPEDVTAISWHSGLHFLAGGIGFLCLIVACFVVGRRYAAEGRRELAWFSRVAGTVFLAGFAGIASGSHGPVTLAFVASVLIVFSWLSTVSADLYRRTRPATAELTTAAH
jgi:hypothetical membrane protein